MCLGEKETNGATILEENNGTLKLDQTLVSFPVGYWRKVEPNYWSDTFKDFKLIAGNYILKINTNALSANNNGLEMNIELKNDKGKVLNKNTRFKVKNNEVSVPFAINHSLLNISMKASVTTIELTGFTIERVK